MESTTKIRTKGIIKYTSDNFKGIYDVEMVHAVKDGPIEKLYVYGHGESYVLRASLVYDTNPEIIVYSDEKHIYKLCK